MIRWLALLLIVMLTLSIAACGDDDNGGTAATPTPAATQPAATQPPAGGDGDAEAGRQIAGTQCVACHSFDGSPSVGPTWQGLYGSEITLESGETVVADDEYIRQSIVDPNAQIHEGYPPVMPSFEGTLSDEQIDNIIAFIRTLD
jgi:cytochrome c oxidase subunit II